MGRGFSWGGRHEEERIKLVLGQAVIAPTLSFRQHADSEERSWSDTSAEVQHIGPEDGPSGRGPGSLILTH